MTGSIWLQGGGEFSERCCAMDTDMLDGVDGPVVVTALAGEVGDDYDRASRNGVRHLSALTSAEVVAAPDIRVDPDGALAVLRAARMLVLPGGSPSRLLSALTATPAGLVLTELLEQGGRVMGASAGAMVLGPWTLLPGGHGVSVAPGLGVVPAVVVPHWSGAAGREAWLEALDAEVPADVAVLGIPEESGVLVRDGAVTSVGQRPSCLVRQGRDLTPHQQQDLPGSTGPASRRTEG